MEPDEQLRAFYHDHLKKVILAAQMLGVELVSTFIGRDRRASVQDTLFAYPKIFASLLDFATDHGVKLATENCPMLREDRWPGGNNIMTTPVLWEQIFEAYPSQNIAPNLDP